MLLAKIALFCFTHFCSMEFLKSKANLESISSSPPLHDILFESLPDLSNTLLDKYILDAFLLLPWIILFSQKEINDTGVIIEKFIGHYLLIMFIRCVTVICTIMPSSNGKCLKDYENEPLGFIRGPCHDKMFSGHTAYMLTFAMILHSAGLLDFIDPVLIYSFVALYAILMVATRRHYTVDIIISALITYFIIDSDLSV